MYSVWISKLLILQNIMMQIFHRCKQSRNTFFFIEVYILLSGVCFGNFVSLIYVVYLRKRKKKLANDCLNMCQKWFYLHDLSVTCCCCCWWSFPIFTIISLATLLLHDDNDSIDNSKASCNAAADDDEVGDGNCCGCVACGGFWFFWPQTLNGFGPFVGSISANNTDIFAVCVCDVLNVISRY